MLCDTASCIIRGKSICKAQATVDCTVVSRVSIVIALALEWREASSEVVLCSGDTLQGISGPVMILASGLDALELTLCGFLVVVVAAAAAAVPVAVVCTAIAGRKVDTESVSLAKAAVPPTGAGPVAGISISISPSKW